MTESVIWDAIYGISRFAALAVLAELGCADHLATGPLTVAELAERCRAHTPSLRRVLREAAAMGVVRRVDEDCYELAEAGQPLRSDVPDSARSAVRSVAAEGFWYAMGALPQTVREGGSALVRRYGPIYTYLAENPQVAAVFDDYMAVRARPFAAGLAEHYDFTGVRRLVDVGGGKGQILAAVLHAHPHLRGVLLDLERVVPAARAALAEAGLADRCECVVGDFFTAVPEGDAHLLANVIHNWNDDDAVRILSNVRAAMPEDGRALILEIVLPDDDTPHVGKDADMRMLALTGEGMERTLTEYRRLLEKSGLALTRVVELPGWAGVLEARRM